MPSSAGQLLEAGRIPGERIATAVETADSSTTDNLTEIIAITVVAPLVDGRTYGLGACVPVGGSVADNVAFVSIREDDEAGTPVARGLIQTAITATTGGFPISLYGEYTASATGNKTFVVSLVRTSGGSGTVRMEASTGRAGYLFVDYVSG